jgi:hypothetical protein
MALLDVLKKDSTNRSVTLRIIDSTDGTPETGVVFNTSGIDLWYRRESAAVVSITEATLAALTTAHTDGGFLHISHGVYRFDIPDAAFATGVNKVEFGGTVTGMVVIGGEIKLVDYDPEDTVRLGLTALPNAVVDAAGGLPISDAGGLDLDTILDAAITTRLAPTVASRTLDVTTLGTAGINWGNLENNNATVDLSDTSINLVDTATDVTTKTGYSLAATGLDAISQAATGVVEIAKAVWDRVLTGGTHNVSNSGGRRLRQLQEAGLYGGAIWVDTVNGTAGTTNFENGTDTMPVAGMADANTLATALGISLFRIAPGSTITLAASQQNQSFVGTRWTLALGNQNIDGSYFFGGDTSGIGTITSVAPVFEDCPIGDVTLPPSILRRCFLSGTITNSGTGDWFINHSMSRVAGTSSPVFDFGTAVGNTNLNMRLWSGGMQLEAMGNTGTDTASIEGNGQVVEGTCTGGTVAIRGNFTTSGVTNLTLVDDARFDSAALVDDVWDEDVDTTHQTAGTAGKKLDDAGAAADPWATALPGAYGAGTAGKIVGDNIDAPLSTIDTVVDGIQTDLSNGTDGLGAIKAETALIVADTNELQTDDVPTLIAALPTAVENADTLLNRDMSTGTDSGSPTVRTVRQALRFLRNKWAISGTTLTVNKEDDSTASWTATVSTDAAADPVTGNDPA